MKSIPHLEHNDVMRCIHAAKNYAQEQQFAVTICICDAGGHILALQRLDGCAPMNSTFAFEKAKTAAISGYESQLFEDIVASGRHAFLSAPMLTSLGGGLPLLVDGHIVGGIGVSGVTAEQDIAVARAGLSALMA